MWLLACMLLVFLSLVEYAVILRKIVLYRRWAGVVVVVEVEVEVVEVKVVEVEVEVPFDGLSTCDSLQCSPTALKR